jgi:hypothetical protein
MPLGKSEQQGHNNFIMWLREKAVEHRDAALVNLMITATSLGMKSETPTCNKSSKSRAASFFISDTFVVKRRIVLQLNDGTCRNLQSGIMISLWLIAKS